MKDQKYTDEQTIKALECCSNNTMISLCPKCAYNGKPYCKYLLRRDALALINRQRAKINRLKTYDEERDIKLHARLIAETEQRVARETFEEIEASLHYKLIGGEIYFIIREADYNEIKKQYTGGGEQK